MGCENGKLFLREPIAHHVGQRHNIDSEIVDLGCRYRNKIMKISENRPIIDTESSNRTISALRNFNALQMISCTI